MHRHRWVEVARRFVPPVTSGFEVNRISVAQLDRMLHGFTVVELRCEECGDVAERHLAGDATA